MACQFLNKMITQYHFTNKEIVATPEMNEDVITEHAPQKLDLVSADMPS